MTILNCQGNLGLGTITGLTSCTALQTLLCANNGLTSLDVTGLATLSELQCQANLGLGTITGLTSCTALGSLTCSNDALTSLDVSGLALLRGIGCSNNTALTTIDGLISCSSLQYLECANCSIDQSSANDIALGISGSGGPTGGQLFILAQASGPLDVTDALLDLSNNKFWAIT
jgi:Leucine-rich repeat (LRR) protein